VYFTENSDKESRSQVLTGNLAGLDEETLWLEDEFFDVPRKNITRLDLRTRPSLRPAGALLGLGIGFATGMLLGLAAGDDTDCFVCYSATDKGLILSVPLGLVGLVLGAVAAPGEQWMFINLDRARLSHNTTSKTRQGVSVAYRF
jgi:hypothetical protein